MKFFRLDTRRPLVGGKPSEIWSGELSRNQGFAVEETRVDVTIGEAEEKTDVSARKEQPIWMVESTVITHSDPQVR